MKKNQTSVKMNNFGIASLLSAFIILCLVVFAILTLSTAKSDYEHSRVAASHKTEYYEACNTSEDIIAVISTVSAADINNRLAAAGINVQVSTEGNVASWNVPIGDTQVLQVAVNTANGNILKWQSVSKGESNESRSNTDIFR